MKYPIIAAGVLVAGMAHAQSEQPTLTVYTYESFVSDWGPGPVIEENFEAICACDLRLVGVGDGAELLGRLRLEGPRTDADVVLGLDTNLIARAEGTGLFAPHGIEAPEFDMPVDWDNPTFLPYDWGYFAFVYDSDVVFDPPESFGELIDSDLSVVIQDPRSSTPGLGLLMWVKAAYGDDAPEIWEGLAPRVLTVTQGWSEAYGLFTEGEADMALSYTTSPAYHLIAEDDPSYAAAVFEEGHYMQVEVAGRIAASDQPELAQEFLRFMLTDGFQGVIPTTNWMYPAVTPEGGLPEGFETLADPDTALLFSAQEAAELRDAALDEWLNALSR
ncbi:thiamine ABC transporter substrate binding subunit [Rhodobacteraceae bacterium WD3A24]|nr:thiamine ABC transporter substrate binding subunit [Rhodobacteraceae bacterium WD3A24]